MTEKHSSVKVAVVQGAPVLFEREATVEKTRELILSASEKNAETTRPLV